MNLRVRPQQLAARDIGAVEPGAGQQAREWVGHLLREPVVRRVVSNWRGRQILQGHAIELSEHRQVLAARADVGGFDDEPPRQLALHANRPAMATGVARLTEVRERHALADVGHQAERRADGLEQAGGERVDQRRDERLPVVE